MVEGSCLIYVFRVYVEGSCLIYVFRVCCVKWCPTSIEYRSNMKGVLEEPGTA